MNIFCLSYRIRNFVQLFVMARVSVFVKKFTETSQKLGFGRTFDHV